MILVLVGEVLLVFSTWRTTLRDIEQKLYWDVAAEIANRIAPELRGGVPAETIRRLFLEYETINPQIEIYLLDSNGNVLVFGARAVLHDARTEVDLAPIRKALEIPTPPLPILGDDPSQAKGIVNVFSVSEVQIADSTGYVYVTLHSKTYRHLFQSTGQLYVVQRAFFGSIMMAFAGIIFGLVLFRYVTKKLEILSSVVEQFGNNNFESRAAIEGNDEVAKLARSINTMADTIVASTEELTKQDELRRTLIANISHDLRGPMTSALGLVESLRSKGEELTEAERHRLLDILHTSLQTEYRLAEDLFELSKLEAKARPPRLELFSIKELANDVVAKLQLEAEGLGIRLKVSVEGDLSMVRADPVLIGRVLTNLVENALRYSDQGSLVAIELSQEAAHVAICVRDQGIGIPAERVPHLFDSFYRAHGDSDPQRQGSGLGLAIVQRIIEMHHQSISVESEVGRGSAFTFRLPLGT